MSGRLSRCLALLFGLGLGLGLAACSSYSAGRSTEHGFFSRRPPAVKPVLAVTDFENKASFSGQWNLGQGMAELLTAELLDSGRVVVLERQRLNDVVGEIVRQGHDLFRKEGRVEKGRLKNAQFLVRGVVTDFTVTGDSSGWFGASSFGLRGRGQRARVAIAVQVSDVTSGEVISSVKTDGDVSAGGVGAGVNYKGVSFGGDAFFRTPLGRATEKAIATAVKRVLHDLPAQPWQARVAEVSVDAVIINGGRNCGVRVGDRFVVRDAPREVTDPVTGNPIETIPGRAIGKIEVREVNDESAHAILLQGVAHRGDHLETTQ
jgi:curli biogenesis system outer membrane secretion channel CsgG